MYDVDKFKSGVTCAVQMKSDAVRDVQDVSSHRFATASVVHDLLGEVVTATASAFSEVHRVDSAKPFRAFIAKAVPTDIYDVGTLTNIAINAILNFAVESGAAARRRAAEAFNDCL